MTLPALLALTGVTLGSKALAALWPELASTDAAAVIDATSRYVLAPALTVTVGQLGWQLLRTRTGRGGILHHRNATMTANLVAALDGKDGPEKLLAVLGRGHLPGIAERLVRDHGFRELRLSPP